MRDGRSRCSQVVSLQCEHGDGLQRRETRTAAARDRGGGGESSQSKIWTSPSPVLKYLRSTSNKHRLAGGWQSLGAPGGSDSEARTRPTASMQALDVHCTCEVAAVSRLQETATAAASNGTCDAGPLCSYSRLGLGPRSPPCPAGPPWATPGGRRRYARGGHGPSDQPHGVGAISPSPDLAPQPGSQGSQRGGQAALIPTACVRAWAESVRWREGEACMRAR